MISTTLFKAALLFGLPVFGLPSGKDSQMPLGASENRLIELSPEERQWMNDDQITDLIRNGIHFIDVTDYQTWDNQFGDLASTTALPKSLRMQNLVKPLFTEISTGKMKEFLTKFSSFNNRYYQSATGVEAVEFLVDQLNAIVGADSKLGITVKKFQNNWKQSSVIVNIPGQSADESVRAETVIIGAHIDSINLYNRMNGRAPGGDDDGSGTTTILESLRVLVGGWYNGEIPAPERTVEFHFYSAEELGLWGSQAIAAEYVKQGRKVYFMMQNDCTGYVTPSQKSTPHFGLITDFVNAEAVEFVKNVMQTYSSMPVVTTKCGYACSDHASWSKHSVRSAFIIEGRMEEMSPFLHSPKDSVDTVDFDHIAEFVKVGVATVVELSKAN
jgi:leucyl aminopeptidase